MSDEQQQQQEPTPAITPSFDEDLRKRFDVWMAENEAKSAALKKPASPTPTPTPAPSTSNEPLGDAINRVLDAREKSSSTESRLKGLEDTVESLKKSAKKLPFFSPLFGK